MASLLAAMLIAAVGFSSSAADALSRVSEVRVQPPTPVRSQTPPDHVEPAPVPLSASGDVLDASFVWRLALDVSGAAWWADWVVATVPCESSFDASVYRLAGGGYPGWYVGLLQVWTEHGYTIEQLQDPRLNLEVSWELYQQYGPSPWPVCGR